MVSSGREDARLYHVRLGGADLTLFTHSFLGLGQDSAQQLGLKTAQSRLEAAALTLTKQKVCFVMAKGMTSLPGKRVCMSVSCVSLTYDDEDLTLLMYQILVLSMVALRLEILLAILPKP